MALNENLKIMLLIAGIAFISLGIMTELLIMFNMLSTMIFTTIVVALSLLMIVIFAVLISLKRKKK